MSLVSESTVLDGLERLGCCFGGTPNSKRQDAQECFENGRTGIEMVCR